MDGRNELWCLVALVSDEYQIDSGGNDKEANKEWMTGTEAETGTSAARRQRQTIRDQRWFETERHWIEGVTPPQGPGSVVPSLLRCLSYTIDLGRYLSIVP